MLCTGWQETTPERKRTARRVEEKVGKIRTKALKIREVVTQKILSAEVRVFYPLPGSRYDAGTMEDAYAFGGEGGKTEPGQPIFCSTGLGLRCIIIHPKSPGSQGSWNTVLKAQVVLASDVEIRREEGHGQT